MPADEATLAKANDALKRFLPIFESWMASHAFVAGDTFTASDIVVRPAYSYAEMAGVSLAAYPAILGWMARCAERPAYAKKA
jgi:glutathione S-transferase